MHDDFSRPPERDLRKQFNELATDPLLSASSLRKKALAGTIGQPEEATLRSLYWRFFLNILSTSPTTWAEASKRHRRQWTDLSFDYLRDPDGAWVDGARPPDEASLDGHETKTFKVFDPLGNERENPWPAWYKDLDTRRMIRQDVDRTFPDIDYFKLPRVRDSMTNILFVFTKLNAEVGYRQGMHEVLAVIFWITDLDSLSPPKGYSPANPTEAQAYTVLSRSYIVHDTYVLFSKLMANMLPWYDPSPSASLPGTGLGSNTAPQMVQPIVAKCARIHDLLRKVDFDLWKRMEELKIEPQIYGIRWMRLLFSREFPMPDVLALWDAMFADEMQPLLHLVDFVCLAMLVRIRESLLDADYTSFLQGLLRHPLPSDGDPRVILLVHQAAYLRDNITNFGGVYIRRQNQQLGAEAGDKSGSRAEEDIYERRATTPLSLSRTPGGATAALLTEGRNLAEGLYGRAEAMGINKALFSTIGELRKSVQAYQQQAQLYSEMPQRQSNIEAAQRQQALDLKRVKTENAAMGNALSAALQILQNSTSDVPDLNVAGALSTMQHVRDVLLGNATHFDSAAATKMMKATTTPPMPNTTSFPPTSLLDENSPTMQSSATLPTSYPPRSSEMTSSSSIVSKPVEVSANAHLPQLPSKSHYHLDSLSGTSALDTLKIDNGTRHSNHRTSIHQLPNSSTFIAKGSSQPTKSNISIRDHALGANQRPRKAATQEEVDPLGVLS